jgi:hypothetical protein
MKYFVLGFSIILLTAVGMEARAMTTGYGGTNYIGPSITAAGQSICAAIGQPFIEIFESGAPNNYVNCNNSFNASRRVSYIDCTPYPGTVINEEGACIDDPCEPGQEYDPMAASCQEPDQCEAGNEVYMDFTQSGNIPPAQLCPSNCEYLMSEGACGANPNTTGPADAYYCEATYTSTGNECETGGGDGTGGGDDGDGTGDGTDDGTGDGTGDGTDDGTGDGTDDGTGDGTGDGTDDGTGDGTDDGTGDGSDDGTGDNGGDGSTDGTGDGEGEGEEEGDTTWTPPEQNFDVSEWDFYEPVYEDGMAAVWEEHRQELMESELFQGIQSLVPSSSSSGCPSFSMNFNMGMANFGSHSLTIDCALLQTIGLIMLASATFTAIWIIW